uniref:OXA1L mitochondrial inner membrane protein n=1 Tax=Oryzias melastigma TaxID=30732 RepID=A0A3B3C066_ORYME
MAAPSIEASSSPAVSPPTGPVIPQTVPEQVSSAPSLLLEAPPTPADPIILQSAAGDAAPTAVDLLQALSAEPRLAELGLAGHTPVGLIQNLLEFFHMDLGLPWWGAIVVGKQRFLESRKLRAGTSLNVRLFSFYKSSEKVEVITSGFLSVTVAKAYSELNMFQKKHDVNPLRGFLVPLVQAPVFISFFIALRKMAYLPVPSLQTGGMLWFTDLTAADPFYILPIAVTGTMFFILELGAESGIDNPNLRAMKTVFRIMPLIILPLTINFPTAVFTYWLTSNLFSLGQVALLRHPAVRRKFNIPEKIQHPASALPQNDGLIQSMKKGWKNAQLAQQLEERERRIKNHLDIAAKGPLRQTFTHNPLQQTPPIAAASSKGKSADVKARPWKDTIG